MKLDVEALCRPVSDASPCGEDLEYDQAFMSLEELAIGTPASQMGDSLIGGKDPDFRKLQSTCLDLWKRTRDMRLACYLAVAGVVLEGLAGFADGLELIQYLLENQWESFWPQLDPDDDNDALERLNILMMISPAVGGYDDPLHFISLFRAIRLVPQASKYTLRDLMIVDNELEVSDSNLDADLFRGEMASLPAEFMVEQSQLVEKICGTLEKIVSVFEEKAVTYSLSFAALTEELKRLRRFYKRYAMAEAEPAAAEADNGVSASAASVSSASAASRPVSAQVFNIQGYHPQTRKEALLLLQKSCEYFKTAEPTSPVPFLLNRALRIAEMDFMELLSELTPDAVDRGRDVLGVRQSNEDNY